MPYILNKTNGTPIAVVQDASIDQTTSLTFLGRNYAGYGEIQNENFLKCIYLIKRKVEKIAAGAEWFT